MIRVREKKNAFGGGVGIGTIRPNGIDRDLK